MKRVIIVGGGYAGTALARALDNRFDVVLIEPREGFVHNVAAIRALVEPELLQRIILPYDHLLTRGEVVRDRADAVFPGGVILNSGASIEGDYVVLATGSTYAQPFKPVTNAMSDFRATSAATHAEIKAARSIVIVGAGAVGVELAGEIAATFKGKALTLIASSSTLFPDFPAELGKRLRSDLEAMGVTVKADVRARLGAMDRPHTGPLQLESGEIVPADLVIPALGARPDTTVLEDRVLARFDRTGRVVVDGWMRPASMRSVFALGDMAANGDLMTIVASSRQVPWLARTLDALASGKAIEDLPTYASWPSPPILIPLGARHGASVLPIPRRGVVVGPFLTRAIKGRSLFIPRYRKEFGL